MSTLEAATEAMRQRANRFIRDYPATTPESQVTQNIAVEYMMNPIVIESHWRMTVAFDNMLLQEHLIRTLINVTAADENKLAELTTKYNLLRVRYGKNHGRKMCELKLNHM